MKNKWIFLIPIIITFVVTLGGIWISRLFNFTDNENAAMVFSYIIIICGVWVLAILTYDKDIFK